MLPRNKKIKKKHRKPSKRPGSHHDHFFRYMFAQIEHARPMLRELLGHEVARQFEWSTLRLEPGSYLDERLQASMSDLLFSIQYQDSQYRALAYLVWDHQRNPHVYMPLRMLNYGGRALRDYTRSNGAIHGYLPELIPVLIYQGPGRWTGPVRLSDLHVVPGEPRRPVFMDLRMIVHEIDDDSIPPEELTAAARTTLRLLRAAALGTLVVEHAKRIADWVAEVHGDAHDDDFEAIVEYILQATKDPRMMNAIIQHSSEETQESLMSVADQLRASGRASGRAEGKAEGRAEGKAEVLLQILAQRFGKLPSAARARIGAATMPELERWTSRLLAAATLDDVFAER